MLNFSIGVYELSDCFVFVHLKLERPTFAGGRTNPHVGSEGAPADTQTFLSPRLN